MVTISFIAGGIIMLTGIYFGLKWQIQITNNEEPTIPNPIELMPKKQEVNLTPELIEEWFEGKKEDE